jgi:hypothetical protein
MPCAAVSLAGPMSAAHTATLNAPTKLKRTNFMPTSGRAVNYRALSARRRAHKQKLIAKGVKEGTRKMDKLMNREFS